MICLQHETNVKSQTALELSTHACMATAYEVDNSRSFLEGSARMDGANKSTPLGGLQAD